MIQELSSIKDQLFDAPTEVKQAFNDVVKYFTAGKSNKSREDRICDGIDEANEKIRYFKSQISKGILKGPGIDYKKAIENAEKSRNKLEEELKSLRTSYVEVVSKRN